MGDSTQRDTSAKKPKYLLFCFAKIKA